MHVTSGGRRVVARVNPRWQSDELPSGFVFALSDALRRPGTFTATEFAQLVAVWEHRSEKHAGDFERYVSRAWNRNRAPLGGEGFAAYEINERGAPPVSRGLTQASGAQNVEWAEPANLWSARFEPVDLPPGVVPPAIEHLARDQAKRLGVDAGPCAAALVTAIGSLVPAGNQMQMRQHDLGWKVKPILWTALVGEPGTNKSSIIKYATETVRSIEKTWAKELTIWAAAFNWRNWQSRNSTRTSREQICKPTANCA